MAANKFSTSGVQTANVLLNAISGPEQLSIARALTGKLRQDFDETAASTVLQLSTHHEDEKLRQDIVGVLAARVEKGEAETVARLLISSENYALLLFKVAQDRLLVIAGSCINGHGSLTPGYAGRLQVGGIDPELESSAEISSAAAWLRFARLMTSSSVGGQAQASSLFRSGIVLLGSEDPPIALAARDLVISLISTDNLDAQLLSRSISALIPTSGSKLHQTLGYSVWLRSLAASEPGKPSLLPVGEADYWEPIKMGLRYGDMERRKLCLDILKRSVAIAIESGRPDIVTRDPKVLTSEIVSQYARYCTVFETLVLARYANLFAECERDLALLASPKSAVKIEWLHTLVATGLDPKIQDQNRKFIGKWILCSELDTSHAMTSFIQFFSNEFLSWAMEGHNFVSTTKQHGGHLSCSHGDQLATYVTRLIDQHHNSGQSAGKVLDSMFSYLVRHHSTMFAYSAVHLLRGIGKAIQTTPGVCLNTQQMELLLEIASWRTLPEVATDYLLLQCLYIYEASEARSATTIKLELTDLGRGRLENLQAAVSVMKKSAMGILSAEDMATVRRSQREITIEAAVAKCEAMSEDSTSASAEIDVQAVLEDIWSDLEYLEYPREMLLKIPAALFNRTTVAIALKEDEDSQTGVRAFLRANLIRVQDLAQRRSFLLAPLVTSVRDVLLSVPLAVHIFDMEAFVLGIARRPSEPTVDLLLEYATLPLLHELPQASTSLDSVYYFGKGEGYGFAAYLDLVSRLGSIHPELIRALLDSMFARWKRQNIPPPTMSAWKTTLQLQVMLLCFEQYAKVIGMQELKPLVDDLFFILSIEPLPRFRYLMEWMVVRLQLQHPDLQSKTLELLGTKDHHSNPKYLASLSKMSVMLASTSAAREDFAVKLAAACIAMSSSSKIVIRHEAQWCFPLLMDQARNREWRSITDNPAYASLDGYIRSLPRFGDPPPERVWSKLDLATDHTMTNLVEGLWTQLDYTRAPYAGYEDFVALAKADSQQDTSAWPASCLTLGPSIPQPPRPQPADDGEPKNLLGPKQMTQEEAIALQTKGTAYLKSSIADAAAESSRKHDLILVASLIENPYNLGGLSRVSEIFGASAMYVRDPRIIAEKDFTSVAVSSHNHLDIQPLTVPDISSFLTEKRNEGWTVVGIEQTDRSVLLGSPQCSLPEKSILVLGSEREGMPAAVLGECDVLVEIPQIGVTRSMNVQTAAAVVLFEYGRQHKK